MSADARAEASLYAPIKAFLEGQGYVVKGEVADCDVVAVRGSEAPVVVELKSQLNFALILQAVDRLSVADTVYVAFRVGKQHSATYRSRNKQVLALLRRLGLGLLTVSVRDCVEAVLDPGPYSPRANRKRRAGLLKEFAERIGDPEVGGSATRQRLTAYRQDALRCAVALAGVTEMKSSKLRERTAVERAGGIVRDNHYGWFARVKIGYYELTDAGREALTTWEGAVSALGLRVDPGKAPLSGAGVDLEDPGD